MNQPTKITKYDTYLKSINTLTCIRVLREARSKAQCNQMLFGIPREHQEMLKWNTGDKVLVTSDKKAGTMTLKVVKDEQ